jgi:hypothetical protein
MSGRQGGGGGGGSGGGNRGFGGGVGQNRGIYCRVYFCLPRQFVESLERCVDLYEGNERLFEDLMFCAIQKCSHDYYF